MSKVMLGKDWEVDTDLNQDYLADREARLLAHQNRISAHEQRIQSAAEQLRRSIEEGEAKERAQARAQARQRFLDAPRGLKVVEVLDDGTETTFKNISAAAKSAGVAGTTVRDAIRKRNYSEKSRRWWYFADEPKPESPKLRRSKPIEYKGQVYPSINALARALNRPDTTVRLWVRKNAERKKISPNDPADLRARRVNDYSYKCRRVEYQGVAYPSIKSLCESIGVTRRQVEQMIVNGRVRRADSKNNQQNVPAMNSAA